MSGQHSIIAPSSAARRWQCAQSTTLEAMFPEEQESEESREGTGAHWAASEQLAGRLVEEGQVAPNGVVLTTEMCRGADLYYDSVVNTLTPYGFAPAHGHIEEPVGIPLVHPMSWGTPDFWFFVQAGQGHWILFIWDYKFGFRIVDIFENPQIVEYIAGILGAFPADAKIDIVARIVQPRAPHRDGPIREWRTTWAKVQPLVARSHAAAHAALGPNPVATPGPECRDCRARHACEALQRAGASAMVESRRVVPLKMTPDQIGLERRFVQRAIELLQARASGLDQEIESLTKQGTGVQGWRVENVEGREKWTVSDEAVIAIGKELKLQLGKPLEAITPKQAREAGLDPAVVSRMSSRARSATRIVEDDGSFTRRIFE